MTLAFLFPGQGSQAVGMGKDLADAFATAREVFQEVDDALSQKLSSLMFEGPETELTLTENTQPALMAVSVAAARVLQKDFGIDLAAKGSYAAGHSLGEYSALCALGALGLADTARLLKLRGQAMQKAVPVGEGAMAALLGLDLDVAQTVVDEAAQGEVLGCANDNGPGQVVISGKKTAVERALDVAKAKGGKRAILLPVSAPFHCALMQPAADAMQEALDRVTLNPPRLPVVSNVTAKGESNPADIKKLLVAQVTGLVRWRECTLWLAQQGVQRAVEIGTGKVLAGLVKRIEKSVEASSLNSPADLEAWAKSV
ncbi:ACP S-malonyltransferase [Ferrovibrio sp.]|uniref:ACP S-malonyltransferase n=1 Tax=Ferrovibrio sp. TaxID=1917215 RepID=UPI0025C01104|nr:ACP S-malonyltransferase [Ferrovibrio sp.]MBX3454118.1 ACP S-malonyltransferase [Ferrovibrio sp.]